MRDLILSPSDELIKNVMYDQIVSVYTDTDQEEVARVIQNYDLLAVPVLTKDKKMRGIVTFDDVMDVLEEEATEDLISFAGVPKSSAEGEELSVFKTAIKRTPWIILLIFMGMLVGGLIGVFEDTLQSVLALSVFIPMIIGTGGNVGTQALAVTVRDINLKAGSKEKIGDTVKKEFGSGLIIGLISGIILFVTLIILQTNFYLSLVVSLAIFLTICFSSVVGAMVPLILNKLNIDPAVASGPFISTIIDAIGLLIYFIIATSLLDYL